VDVLVGISILSGIEDNDSPPPPRYGDPMATIQLKDVPLAVSFIFVVVLVDIFLANGAPPWK
jgi:hypothetical protein